MAHIFVWLFYAGLLSAIGPAAEAQPSPPREIYLIQNSGWMEPFYLDTRAPFRPLLRALIQSSALPNAQVTIASFNQAGQLGDRPSPLTLYAGPLTDAALTDALKRLDLPVRADKLYTDADYNGALSETIPRLLSGAPGVIWMVTNNKNSRSNDQHVVENTSRFSSLLTGSDFIKGVIAYPLRLAAQGPKFSEKGLVIYGIAYGEEAAGWLRQAADSTAMRQLLTDKPVRLKPLEVDPMRLTLAGEGSHGIRLSASGDAIVADGLAGGAETTIDIPGSLTSNYYPQVIEQASLKAEWIPQAGSPPVSVAISPTTINGMGPDESVGDVHVRLIVPAIARLPGLAGLLQSSLEVHGLLRLQLTDVHLGLQHDFVKKMSDLFDTDAERIGKVVMQLDGRPKELPAALPAIFLDHQAITSATTDVPVGLGVLFSPWPLILLISVAVFVLLLLSAIALASSRERLYSILVGSETINVTLRPFRTATLRSRSGVRVAVTGRLLRNPKVVTLS